MASRLLPLALAFSCIASAGAQTYNPKKIELQGAEGLDRAQLQQLLQLQPGAPVSKEQIEAAMQRLADSGLFADLSYKVDANALTIIVTPTAGSQAQPVRYANFVWWTPAELEPLVEARVPLFHGKLPLTGQLTSQVQAALVSLLAEKGITGAKVEAMQSNIGGTGVALTITQPEVHIGQVLVSGTAPEAAGAMKEITARLAGRDYDSEETPATLINNTLDAHRNAGFLDAAINTPSFTPPHKDLQAYAVDANVTVRPGTLYRIASVKQQGLAPQLEAEALKASGLKVGDPARAMEANIGAGLAARVLSGKGHLEAIGTAKVTQDDQAHTADYTLLITPGPVYRFAAVDTTALSAEGQRRFAASFHAQPGTLADKGLLDQIRQALQDVGVTRSAVLQQKLDRSAQTVTYVIASKTGSGAGQP